MSRLFLTLCLLLSIQIASAADFKLDDIPDGYPQGLPDAPYGSYSSRFGLSALVYQLELERLDRKVYGLGLIGHLPEVRQAELVYFLEHALIAQMLKLLHARPAFLTGYEREALFLHSIRLYQTVRQTAERLCETATRRVDEALPGATGCQYPKEVLNGQRVLYSPNYRSDAPLTTEQAQAAYQKKIQEYLSAGGKLEDLQILSRDWINSQKNLIRTEYVVRPNDEIWVSSGEAGHLILAGGQSVFAAGQLIILKDAKKNPVFAVLSNASGNYKPDLWASQQLALRLSREYSIPLQNIVLTKGEPLSTQSFRLLLKAQKIDAEQIRQKVKELRSTAEQIIQRRAYSCESLLQTSPAPEGL